MGEVRVQSVTTVGAVASKLTLNLTRWGLVYQTCISSESTTRRCKTPTPPPLTRLSLHDLASPVLEDPLHGPL